ncbi:hypothetical protein C0989_005870 [Termitomyces sp. Mn162]|nr:hypothetical protein C0989_005870 [Termitomyces sp. Mn162]
MLALVNTSQRDVPRPQSHVRQDITSPTVPEATVLEDRLCPGCKNPAVNEQGGLVVAFGSHVQKKAEREREKRAGGSGSTKSRERAARDHHAGNNGALNSPTNSHAFSGSRPSSSRDQDTTQPIRSPIKSYVSDAFAAAHQAQSSSSSFQPTPSSSLYPSQSISVTTAPPIEPNRPPPLHLIEPSITSEVECLNPVKQRTLPVPGVSQDTPGERRRSYDDGVRPLNVLFGKESSIHKTSDNPLTTPVVSNGLTARPSRRDKRHSINPGISLPELNTHTSTQISQFTVSPHSISSPANTSADRVPTLLSENGRESHPSLSPLREEFPSKFPSSLRSTSHDNLQWSNSSRHSSSSGLAYADEQELSRPLSPTHFGDQTIVITVPPMAVTVGSVPSSKARTKVGTEVTDPNAGGSQSGDACLSSGTKELEVLRSQRSPDSIQHAESRRTSTASLGAQAQPRSRSVSPAHVPQNVESETNTDLEAESPEDQTHFQESLPSLSLKDAKGSSTLKEASVAEEADMTSPSVESGSEDLSESSPVEYTSHSTFIAPALPPIRLSLSSNDFSELLNSVGGFPSRISLSQLTKIPEGEKSGTLDSPPTAADLAADITPTPRAPLLPPTVEESEAEDDTIKPQSSLPSDSGHPPSEARNDAPPPPTKPSKVNGVFRRPSSSSASDSSHSSRPKPAPKSEHVDVSTVSPTTHNRSVSMKTRITLTGPDSKMSTTLSEDGTDITVVRLQEAVADARDRGAQHLKMDRGFVEAILSTLETQKMEYLQLRSKFDGVKRTSKQYIEGLTVAQTEYDRELKARRDAEAEVTRLRVLLSGKVAKLTVLSGDNRKEKLRQQLSKELHDSLSGLELDLSNLKVERDMALAEVEELEATKSGSSEMPPANLGRSLTKRLESIKHQYKRDLLPLTREKESLQREIAELKAVRDVFLEETTVLNARNEELAQLSAAYSRRMETVPEVYPTTNDYHDHGRGLSQLPYQSQQVNISHSLSSSTSSTLHDETMDLRSVKLHKQESDPTPSRSKFMNMKWGSRAKELTSPQAVATGERKIALIPHNFQQLSILRFTRCDHCGDKMWGSQLRCTVCPISTHVRCVNHLQISCIQQASNVQSELIPASLLPSMFGRDLIEQARADARGEDRQVPVIVEKCIQAVEAIALEYEGIYRKTGGAGQSKLITQLFERGDYTSFDLRDSDRFNDICSVTSVLKNYFRSLPVPLLTYDHHDDFMTAVQIKDHAARDATLLNLVNKLPDVHYYTLRMLMLHLHRVRDFADINKMNARNIGVVFGPTLMRPRDPAQEFNDMAGKAIAIEWLVENAPRIFNIQDNSGYQA